ncbi:hypothetical protein B0H17DRAFT_1022794 [Mycena rosella]|uniref:HNH nuclease domain-containing protein n=1 Tax=Mycena rosella TaxID=1033263 RepID=A0AAD7FY64_MYCRO|nr:hypothetical protein B0H17DRAFT_1022794 [Mycena rosella]
MHVRLVLLPSNDFSLEIPIDLVPTLCTRPVKFLRFLGWCILGAVGVVSMEPAGSAISDDASLEERGVYFYVLPEMDDPLRYAVDLEAVKVYSQVPSETSATREDFSKKVAERDVCCIFTNSSAELCDGAHIIPFSKGDEVGLESLRLTLLQTPNPILNTVDIPGRSSIGRDLKYGVKYSEKDRYTLQSLTSTDTIRDDIANNLDAAFKLHNKKPKPSPLLLHYNYGVAAVIWWGKGESRLHASNRPNIPRPKVPVPAPMGPRRVMHDRQVTRDKLEHARAEDVGSPGTGSAARQYKIINKLIKVLIGQEEIGQNKLKLGLGAHWGLYDPPFKVRR